MVPPPTGLPRQVTLPATGTGLGQVASTAQFGYDVATDEAEPEGPGDWMQGIVTGRMEPAN